MNSFSNSNLQKLAGYCYCVAIVEVVNDPTIKVVDINGTLNTIMNQIKYYVVTNDDLMQLRNLLVYSYRI